MALPSMTLEEARALFKGTPLEGSEELYYYRLPPPGYSAETDRALALMIQGGVSPENIRELDAWMGAVHFEYELPGGPTGNVNVWVLDQATNTWRYVLPNGQRLTVEEASQWPNIPPPPAIDASGQWQPRPVPPPPGPEPRALPPQTTGTVQTSNLQATGGNIHMADTSIIAQLRSVAMANMGTDRLNWDQWNYYYAQITGENGPAPEDRGFTRTAGGSVVIDGQAAYPVEVWWQAAFGQTVGAEPQPPGQQTPGSRGGAGAGGILTGLLALLVSLIRLVISGRT